MPKKQRQITEEEFKDWKQHPVTRRIFLLLQLDKMLAYNAIRDLSGSAQYVGEEHIRYKGMIRAIDSLLDVDVDDVNSLSEGEYPDGGT